MLLLWRKGAVGAGEAQQAAVGAVHAAHVHNVGVGGVHVEAHVQELLDEPHPQLPQQPVRGGRVCRQRSPGPGLGLRARQHG
jgi:hypothetical protein